MLSTGIATSQRIRTTKVARLSAAPGLIVFNDLLLVVCTIRYSPSEFSAAGESRKTDAK